MRVNLEVNLRDIPGELLRVLEPIAKYGGNIVSIIHLRDRLLKPNQRVKVNLIVEVPSQKSLENIIKEIESRGIFISKVGEVKRRRIITVALVGHIVDTDLRDTIDRINDLKYALVEDVSLSMPSPEKESSAIFEISLDEGINLKKFYEELERICKEKNLLIIREI